LSSYFLHPVRDKSYFRVVPTCTQIDVRRHKGLYIARRIIQLPGEKTPLLIQQKLLSCWCVSFLEKQ